MALLDKAALKTWRGKSDLHILLIMQQEDVNKIVATAQAYHEGVEGLAKRQAPAAEPKLPLAK